MNNTLALRPRFKYLSDAQPHDLAERLVTHQQRYTDILKLDRRAFHLVISFLPHKQQVWSPQLTVELEPEEGGCLLRGLFAPNPSIWTFFMFLYGGFGIFTVFAAMFGATQLTLGHTPWALWLLPALILGVLLTYLAAQYGKRKAQEQMDFLKNFFIEAMGEALLKARHYSDVHN